MFQGMLFASLLDEPTWYGPATATFHVQFAGDPYDPAQNDVRVRFLGEKSAREERVATFDPNLGVWRATLFAQEGGRYRAILVRNGKEKTLDAEEGIVDLPRAADLGLVRTAGGRKDRLVLDTGGAWTGVGADLGASATPERIDSLAKAGATWVRLAPPDDPLSPDALAAFDATMAAVTRSRLFYTLAVPAGSSSAWRRYALARYGGSPYLVQWDAPEGVDDPWSRATASSAIPWEELFENRPGPFVASEPPRIKALRGVLDASGWSSWTTPRAWSGAGVKGVGESDRMILAASPGAKLVDVPLPDGTYDLTTLDPGTGASTVGTAKAEGGRLPMPTSGERFFVLRRKI